MTPRQLLSIAIAAATVVAACGDDSTESLTNGRGRSTGRGDVELDADGLPVGEVATNSPSGKDYYKANVHSFLSSGCSGCHGQAGPGPFWITGDAEKAYFQLFSQGYVARQSRIVQKPAHGGITTNKLNAQQLLAYNEWVEIELRDGGEESPPNILAKLGSCFDQDKFDAIKMGDWRTKRRNGQNNENAVEPWNENANDCTGCNNTECAACHSADPATHYNNAYGNPLLPPNTTFDNSKLINPAYITKYFGVSPDGQPIASNGIKKKSDATKKDKAYTHPMFELSAEEQQLLDAFINDVLAKYAAGTCGQ